MAVFFVGPGGLRHNVTRLTNFNPEVQVLKMVFGDYARLLDIIFLVQACLRAPHVVADEAKLAIVFTYFFLSFFFSSFFFFLRLLLFTHFGESAVRENLFPPIFWHN